MVKQLITITIESPVLLPESHEKLEEALAEFLAVEQGLTGTISNSVTGNTVTFKKKAPVEVCSICGESVAFGSGKYVNRVPDGNTPEERKEMGREHPEGDFICGACEEAGDKEQPRCPLCGFVMDQFEDGWSCQNTGCVNSKMRIAIELDHKGAPGG